MKMSEAEESKALQVANWLTEKAVGGVGPLSSAEELALEYLNLVIIKKVKTKSKRSSKRSKTKLNL